MFFTKKRVLIGSFIISILDIVLFKYSEVHTGLCELGVSNLPIIACLEILIAYILTMSIPIFIFSLIVYKLKERVFLLWKKFTFIYLSIYLFIVIIAPWRHADFSPFEKGPNTLFLLIIYIVLSIIIISYKSIILHKYKKQKLN